MSTLHLFLNVGQGQASVSVDQSTGQALVIDCASGALATIKSELPNRPLDVRLIVVTHLDWDHCAELMQLVRAFNPQSVRINNDTAWKLSENFPQLKSLLRGLQDWNASERPARWRAATVETPPNDPPVSGISWQILAPEASDISLAHEAGRRNYASVVLKLSVSGRNILFCGDTNSAVLERIESDDPHLLDSEIMVFPHHGGQWQSAGTDIEETLRKIDPEVVVISAGAFNGYGHPLPENIESVSRVTRARVMCTQVTPRCFGANTLSAHREAVGEGSAMSPPADPRCAGTIRVEIDGNGYSVTPDKVEHQRRIDLWPHPCCQRWSSLQQQVYVHGCD